MRRSFSEQSGQKRRRCWLAPYLAIGLAALAAGVHLLRAVWWASGDGLHHLHRVAALARAWGQGIFYTRWIGEFAFGYGVPVFNFYSPLSYYFAQLFAPLGPFWALKLTLLAGLLLSGWFLYLFAKGHVGTLAATVAAAVYVVAPYRLVDLYPRAAVAEHLAFLWLPLILWAFDGAWTGRRRAWQVIGWAGLVLTHSFTALMFAPFFVLYVLWTAWRRRQARPLGQMLVSLLLALGLTAFFWLPLFLEAPYANLGQPDDSRGYRNHLIQPADLVGPLLYDYATGDGRVDSYFAFGAVPALTLLLGALGTAYVARRILPRQMSGRADGSPGAPGVQDGASFLPTYGIVICLAALFMVSRPAQPLWDLLAPVLAPIQFPWRFLSIATLGVALASIGLIEGFKGFLPSWRQRAAARGGTQRTEQGRTAGAKPALALGGALALLLLVTGLARLPFEPVTLSAQDALPESLWTLDRETGQAGTTWGGEFLPIGVKEQRWALGRAPETPRAGPAMLPVTVSALSRRGDSFRLAVESAQPWTFRLHAFYFPGWQVRINGKAVATTASGDLGLVSAQAPAGAQRLDVAFESTAVRRAAKAMTALALVLIPFVLGQRQGRRWRIVAGIWAAGVITLLYAILPVLPRTFVASPTQALFADQAQLVGVEVADQARPGQSLPVTLYWLSLRENSRNDKTFVHLVDAQGQVVAQHDGDPGGGFTPTSRWQPGELIPDRHYLALPASLLPGSYRLKAGLYRFDPFENLLTAPPTEDGRVDLGEVVLK